MGYSLTTEAETAVPAKSPASPKTHTPDSRLSNLGLRYYSPSLSRWIHRDPVEEEGGTHLYCFLLNNCVNRFDPDGRTPWNPARSDYGDGCVLWYQGYWWGRPWWDPNGRISGGTLSEPPHIEMELGTCSGGSGCVQLELTVAFQSIWMWYWYFNTTAFSHERRHADTFHRLTFVPTKQYAESLEHCYETEENAECWQSIAEGIVPLLNYYKGILANLELDGLTGSAVAATARAHIAETEGLFNRAEAQCAQ